MKTEGFSGWTNTLLYRNSTKCYALALIDMIRHINMINLKKKLYVLSFQDTVNLMVLIFVDDTPVSDKNISGLLITLHIITN